ncbi:MAG: stage III sporulation protein AF [Clostridia bacterium]|nr:stage III sporulation protein AF [Clostridia bacterium]
METVKNLIASLCVALVFSGVAMMLLPESTMKKSIKTLVSVIVISVIISCVFGVSKAVKGIDFSSDNFNLSEASSKFSKTVQIQTVESTESAVKTVIVDEFNKSGINSAEVLVFADITEDNRIYIKRIEVVCDNEELAQCRIVLDKLSVCEEVCVTERK